MEPTRITPDAWLVGEGIGEGDESNMVFVEYRIGDDWTVRLTSEMYTTVSGPVHLEIKVADADRMNDPALAEGITTHALRAIPMKDARSRLGWWMADAYKGSGDADTLPRRFSEPGDFAMLAKLYVRRIELGDPNPIRTLSEQHGVTRNTLAARVRSARSQGLLTPETPSDRGQLTAAAEALLKEMGDR
jgi:hypothetical protein